MKVNPATIHYTATATAATAAGDALSREGARTLKIHYVPCTAANRAKSGAHFNFNSNSLREWDIFYPREDTNNNIKRKIDGWNLLVLMISGSN